MSLMDITPLSETYNLRGEQLILSGVTVKGISSILKRFPIVAGLLSGNATIQTLYDDAPDAVAAIIAAGCGFPDNEKAEKIARELTFVEAIDLLASIILMTMPNGFGPFVESLTKLGLLVQPQASGDGKSKTDGTSLAA